VSYEYHFRYKHMAEYDEAGFVATNWAGEDTRLVRNDVMR